MPGDPAGHASNLVDLSMWRRFQFKIRAVFRKSDLDAEMNEEMRRHIEMRTQQNIEAGMSPEEARFAALRQFGWLESIKQTCREVQRIRVFQCGIDDER